MVPAFVAGADETTPGNCIAGITADQLPLINEDKAFEGYLDPDEVSAKLPIPVSEVAGTLVKFELDGKTYWITSASVTLCSAPEIMVEENGVVEDRIATPAAVDGGVFVLISQAEYDELVVNAEPVSEMAKKFKAPENAPLVHLLKPSDLEEPLGSPLDLDLKFEALAGAEIVPESIRFEYRIMVGWMDITERILEHTEVGVDGLVVTGAELPKGKHKIRLVLEDTNGRMNQYVYAFKIR